MATLNVKGLQLAAAMTNGCATFLTNDRRIPAIPGLRILGLDSCC